MRALLVDDQIWLRAALRLLLEHTGNIEVVGEATNLLSLPYWVSHLHPDLLFLDWQLPGMETARGRQECIERVRAIAPDLYIIALTNDDHLHHTLSESNSSDEISKSGRLSGADAFVNKAEPPDHIIEILRHAENRALRPS
jgi:DNA-binding NarL/FixJ family response regulator